ncbi:ATP-binding protein [uncultured Coprobacter sp.]|uniref:ATP-binding protein n=1 Tax=uncultured Coprobacter sp. TaxID=1720550 RepID=UPI002596C89D|nr:ATP-binding protein [uncultured Coprobacter sp.]
MATKIIGKVSATEKSPSTVDDFYFWTDKKTILSPFDVVKVHHVKNEKGKNSITYGVVEEIFHITDATSHITSYLSSDFGEVEDKGNMYRLGMNYVKAKVVCNTDNIYTPVLDGQQVETCDEDDVLTALGLKNPKNPVVCGYLKMYQEPNQIEIPISVNSHFLIGPEGAHLNISGISGLAAKTSYAMFLLKNIQQKFLNKDFEEREDKNQSVAFIFFNVKGRDLLALNEPNEKLPDGDKRIYKNMGWDTAPFKNVKFYYPFSSNKNVENVQSYVETEHVRKQIDLNEAFKYKYIYEQDRDNLDLLLANEDDSTGTLDSIVNLVLNNQGNFGQIQTWTKFLDEIQNRMEAKSTDNGKDAILPTSWRKFKRVITKAIGNDVFSGRAIVEANNEVRLNEAVKQIKKNEVMVIDVARLDEDTQSFVFGDVARAVYDLKLGGDEEKLCRKREDIPGKIIIFVDELNKYASTDVPKKSPILRQLLDIAERGRSLGIILFSAEQFKSAIHDRVKGNCATHAYGRTNAIEISKADYRFIPKVYQNMMTRLEQGEYIIQNPVFRSLINIKFPRPTYKQL